MAGLQTEFEFRLPKGFVDPEGRLHRRGRMRLATARDEIEPLRDPRISDDDDPYLTVLVLARVITSLGTHTDLGVGDIESLFAADLAFLQDLYGVMNFGTNAEIQAVLDSVPPFDDDPEERAEVPAELLDPSPEGSDGPPRRRATVEEVPTEQAASPS